MTTDADLLRDIDRKVTEINVKLNAVEKSYITRAEFAPIQKIVYGLVGVILLSFMGAILALVIKSGGAA